MFLPDTHTIVAQSSVPLLNLTPSPSEDLRGVSATAPVPFVGLRPSTTETADIIQIRTLVLQLAIDTLAATGGGRIYISAGLFLINQIILKSNVEIWGAGKGKTIFLDSGKYADGSDRPSGTALFETQNYHTNLALYISDPATSPKFFSDGAIVGVVLNGFTVDGWAYVFDDLSSWDMTLDAPNDGLGYGGIFLFASGVIVENVQVIFTDDYAMHLYRGSGSPKDNLTVPDNIISTLKYLNISFGNTHGLYIHGHADGVIQELVINGFTSGTGWFMDGGNWNIGDVHIWNCLRGLKNSGKNSFQKLQCEACLGIGFENASGGAGTIIYELFLFFNARDGGVDAGCILDTWCHVLALDLNMQQTQNETGIKINAGYCKITGRIGWKSTGTGSPPSGCIGIDMTDAANCDIDIGGWANDGNNSTVIKMLATSKANKINIRNYGGMEGTGTNRIFKSVNGSDVETAIGYTSAETNRITIRYHAGTVDAVEAYFDEANAIAPYVELIAY